MINNSRNILLFFSSAILLLHSACSLPEINRQLEVVDTAANIAGEVKLALPDNQAVIVNLYKDEGSGLASLISQFPLTGEGKYTFHTPVGGYFIAAFVDSDGDGVYQKGEPATYYGIDNNEPSLINASKNEVINLSPLEIKGALETSSGYTVKYNLSKAIEGIGKLVSLNDSMFSDEFASMGMWGPLDFIDQGGGWFIYSK